MKKILKEQKKREKGNRAKGSWFTAGMFTWIALGIIGYGVMVTLNYYIYYSVGFLMLILGLGTWKWSEKPTIIGGILRGMLAYGVTVMILGVFDLLNRLFGIY